MLPVRRRSLFPLRLGSPHGARLRLCRGLGTVLRGMCRALEAEEEEAKTIPSSTDAVRPDGQMRVGCGCRHRRHLCCCGCFCCC